MAHAAGDAHAYPVYGYHYRITVPLLDADGDLTTGGGSDTPDSERSIDGGTFADCTNEMSEIATNSGMYTLDLTGAELTAKCMAVIMKTATAGTKTTPVVLYPRRLPVLETDTAEAGAGSTITLAAATASAENDFYNGLFIGITNNSPAGAQYQLRRIISYVGSTRVATVDSAWGTNPSNASTYDVLIPEGYSTAAWGGIKIGTATNRGLTALPNVVAGANGGLPLGDANSRVDVGQWLGTAPLGLNNQRVQVDVQAIDGLAYAATVLGLWLAEGVQTVADSGTTTTLVDAVLTQADDHWNGALLIFRTGTNIGRTAIITDFDAATNTLTFAPAVPDAVTTEGYVLVPGLGHADNAAAVKTAIEAGGSSLAQILADTGELQTNQDAWATATGFSTHDAAAVVTALGTGSTLTACGLASDGLDQISAAEPSAKPSTFAGWIMWLVQIARRSKMTSDTLTVEKEDGTAVTTQSVSDDSTTQQLGPPSNT